MGQVVPVTTAASPARLRFTQELAGSVLSGNPAAQARFFRLCRALARRAGGRFFVQAHADDIAQDLALHVLSDSLPVFAAGGQSEDDFFLAMLNAARAIAQRYQRSEMSARKRASSVGPEGLDADGEESHRLPEVLRDDATPEHLLEEAEQAQAQARALAEIKARMRATPTQVIRPSSPAAIATDRKDSEGRADPAPSEADPPEPVELVEFPPPTLADLLEALGMSLETAQVALGLPSLGPLDAAGYDARSWAYRLIQRENGIPQRRPARDWLESWGQRLGFEPGDYRGLAGFFGLHYSTLHRWYNGRACPTIGRLGAISKMARTSHLWKPSP